MGWRMDLARARKAKEKQTVPMMRHYRIRGNGMDIGKALAAMNTGDKVARAGWNGKGMYLLHAEGGTFSQEGQVMGDLEQHIVMKTADDKFVPWLCSQTDLLATDWEVVQ